MLDFKNKPSSYYFTEVDLKKILLEVVPRSEILIPMKRKQLVKELEANKDRVVNKYITQAQLDYLKTKKEKNREPEYLVEDDINKINQYLSRYPDSEIKQTQKAIITSFIGCGFRVQELCDFDINSLDTGLNRIKILGKGKKWRWTHIEQNFMDFLTSFKQKYSKDLGRLKNSYDLEYQPMFLNSDSKPYTPRNIQKFMDTISKAIPDLSHKLHPHILRHTYAVSRVLKNPTLSLEELRKDMGHEDIRVTQIYFSLAESERIKLANQRKVRDVEMKYCNNCGKQVSKISNFCNFCGANQN